MAPIKESDDEDLSQPDDITCGPIVEIVEEECASQFVYNNAEELFPTAKVHIETLTTNHTIPDMNNIEPMFDEPQEQLTPMS